MTNREWLDSLPNERFATIVLGMVAEFESKNFNPMLDVFDVTNDVELDICDWLEEEHKSGDQLCIK